MFPWQTAMLLEAVFPVSRPRTLSIHLKKVQYLDNPSFQLGNAICSTLFWVHALHFVIFGFQKAADATGPARNMGLFFVRNGRLQVLRQRFIIVLLLLPELDRRLTNPILNTDGMYNIRTGSTLMFSQY